MKLIQCRYSSGQRVPLLVQTGDAASLPMLVPFIYVQLKLRYRAYNTAAAHLRAIRAFYTYTKTRDLDIDKAILACHFSAICVHAIAFHHPEQAAKVLTHGT